MNATKQFSKVAVEYSAALNKVGGRLTSDALLKALAIAFPNAKHPGRYQSELSVVVAEKALRRKGDAMILSVLAMLCPQDTPSKPSTNFADSLWDWLIGGKQPRKTPSCREAELNWEASQQGIWSAGAELQRCLDENSSDETDLLLGPSQTDEESPPIPDDPCSKERKALRDALDWAERAYDRWAAACA